jgi:hypothetical protein
MGSAECVAKEQAVVPYRLTLMSRNGDGVQRNYEEAVSHVPTLPASHGCFQVAVCCWCPFFSVAEF